jgi:glutaminyl-tRNA synthetase
VGFDKTMTTETPTRNFIRDIIADDMISRRHSTIVTRFPPEPNGYLHLGHAKSIVLNFGLAQEFGGHCYLRLDDTNPAKEELIFAAAIRRDVHWLGYDWKQLLRHASDYFDQLYDWATYLIRSGKAYVDDQSQEEICSTRGTLTAPGQDSPFRARTIAENLDLFLRMRAGEFPEGSSRVLRAKIDMSSGNINLRDPVLYRILHRSHPRTGSRWCIYPSYDFAHGQSDAIEGITHSIATLEFADHRALYDWLLDNLPVPSRPRQLEFARLQMTHTVLSKRALAGLVSAGLVSGWDDPRMPTLAGLRRRGIPPAAIRDFIGRVGIARSDGVTDYSAFEFSVRELLNRDAPRRLAVLRPITLVIENSPVGATEHIEAPNHPANPSLGTRSAPLSREPYIEREDFVETPSKGFFRLAPGREIRLRYSYVITCQQVVKDDNGCVTEIRCSYNPSTRGARIGDRKVATIHWVSALHAVPIEVRLYDHLFLTERPSAYDFESQLNKQSVDVLSSCMAEPALAADPPGTPFQFERHGYFVRDAEFTASKPVFNRTVGLRGASEKRMC